MLPYTHILFWPSNNDSDDENVGEAEGNGKHQLQKCALPWVHYSEKRVNEVLKKAIHTLKIFKFKKSMKINNLN